MDAIVFSRVEGVVMLSKRTKAVARSRRSGRPGLERLETRAVPAVFNISPSADAASLRTTIAAALVNEDASDTINLGTGIYRFGSTNNGSTPSAGQIRIDIPSGRTLTMVGDGASSTSIDAAKLSRVFEIVGQGSVVFRNLSIVKGKTYDGGLLGSARALGGGLLIEGSSVTLDHVTVSSNVATGAVAPGGLVIPGAGGRDAAGGGLYLASGSVTLVSANFSVNSAEAGSGIKGANAAADGTTPGVKGKAGLDGITGADGLDATSEGGNGGDAFAGSIAFDGTDATDVTRAVAPNGDAGNGGDGGDAFGGGIYVANGSITAAGSTFSANSALGGDGGWGGTAGNGVVDQPSGESGGGGGNGGFGGNGGNARGSSASVGGDGGDGGNGGDGGAGGKGGAGADGYTGGAGGTGGDAFGGAFYVAAGTLELTSTQVGDNTATGGAGGNGGFGENGTTGGLGATGGYGGMGGDGGNGGVGSLDRGLGGVGGNGGKQGLNGNGGTGGLGGKSGDGGDGGSGWGGGFYVSGGSVRLTGVTLLRNLAIGGKGGAGVQGAFGGGGGGTSLLIQGGAPVINPGSGGFGGIGGAGHVGAVGGTGGDGSPGGLGGAGGSGGDGGTGAHGGNGIGGGIAMTAGDFELGNAQFTSNTSRGGVGGNGGTGGTGGVGHAGGEGGAGGGGGPAGIGVVGGTGGNGGFGGDGGDGGPGGDGGYGGNAGPGGSATGGAVFVSGGRMTKSGAVFQSNAVTAGLGGAGGAAGTAGPPGAGGKGGAAGSGGSGTGSGLDGVPGVDGMNGKVGADGIAGTTGSPGTPGIATFKDVNGTILDVSPRDTTPPTADMTALPANSSTLIQLSWSGADEAGGSGLDSFDVFVNDNGGVLQPLLSGTKATSTTFNGSPGHTYGFLAVARDVAGNRIATPTMPQTTTHVAPIGAIDAFLAAKGKTLSVPAAAGILANDRGGTSAVLVAKPSFGTLTLDPSGGFTYKPGPKFKGSDRFTYQPKDASGALGAVTTVQLVPSAAFKTASTRAAKKATSVSVTVTLSAPSDAPVVLSYGVVGGSAAAGLDFVAPSGSVTIPIGKTSASIVVRLITNPSRKGSATIVLGLNSVTNAVPGKLVQTTVSLS